MDHHAKNDSRRREGNSGYRGGHQDGSRVGSRDGSYGNPWQRSTPRFYQKPPEVEATPRPAFGPLIRTITMANIDFNEDEPAVITDCELVGSYNWLRDDKPSILIPGGPPRWAPLPHSPALTNDVGPFYHDINSTRLPLHPMEPVAHAVRAIKNAKGKNKTGENLDVDIVACGSTLGNLLRFIRLDELQTEDSTLKSFQIVAHLVGGDNADRVGGATLFLVRRENSPNERIQGMVGYGYNFCDSYTKWDTEKSASHQRLLKYSFGDLKILVRSEADAYMQDKLPSPTMGDPKPVARKTGIDEIDDMFSNLKMDTEAAKSSGGTHVHNDDKGTKGEEAASNVGGLQVCFGGKLLPQQAICDIKTRSAWKRDRRLEILQQEMPRLWLRQTPTLILAFHHRGVFSRDDIEVLDAQGALQKWEQDHQKSLQKLAGLLWIILDQVKSLRQGSKMEICYTEGDVQDSCLEFREPGPGAMDALSKEGQRMWTGRDVDEDEEIGFGVTSEDFEDGDLYYDEDYDDDDGSEKDFTACSVSDCGYCGKCPY